MSWPWVRAAALCCLLSTSVEVALAGFPGPGQGLADGSDPGFAQEPPAELSIPGQYLVLFKDDAFTPAVRASSPSALAAESANLGRSLAQRHGANMLGQWGHAVQGMSAQMTPQAALAMAKDPRVALVEPDAMVYATAVQTPAIWGLDRVDQRSLPLDNRYLYSDTAQAITAYVIDTGILTSHQEFGGRATWGANFTGDGTNTDCNGHGTHVAGTLGGTTYGVAKEVALVAVKVLGCNGSGSISGVVSGIDWMVENKRLPAVANLSLGGGYSGVLNDAIASATLEGITMVVAAGNDALDACNHSPASAPSALTVGASTNADARSSFSNWGTCLDLFAPGSAILSATNTSNTATATLSGTSMATPHVAGAAALVLAADPELSVSEVADALIEAATPGILADIGNGSPNLLLYTGSDDSPYLAVTKTGDGRVTSAPQGIDCGTLCSADFPEGTNVTLTAEPTGDGTFVGWSGDCTGTGVCNLTMNGPRQVSAAFQNVTYPLSVSKVGSGTVTSAPSGIDCGSNCVARFDSGTQVTLNANASIGYYFAGWGGACAGSGACTVTMTQGRTVTATFARLTYNLVVSHAGAGLGTVTSNPAGIDCGEDCAEAFNHGTSVTLTPTPAPLSAFTGWSGDCTGTGACTVLMTRARAVTASFTPIGYTLTVNRAGEGTGTVTSSPPGIDCGEDCAETYAAGTAVNLTAIPAPGAIFAGWSGACTGTGACLFQMNQAHEVTATFNETYMLTLTKEGSGTVTSTPSGIDCGSNCVARFDSGTQVTLNANASIGYYFAGWGGACAGSGACTVTMTRARAVTASFTPIGYTLTVNRAGEGTGTVTSSPPGIDCGEDCAETYAAGTAVNLTAIPAPGAIFAGWSGACTGTGICTLDMIQPQAVSAIFNIGLQVNIDDPRDFVEQQYRDFLGREGDPGGVDYWSGLLAAGLMSRAEIVDLFFSSEEFQSSIAPVTRLYFAYFERIPDYGGLMFWMDALLSGESLDDMSQTFAESDEFLEIYGELEDAGFIDLVYENLLGRAPDEEGRDYWINSLAMGLPRGQLMIAFSESNEYRVHSYSWVQVNTMYVSMLRHAPDPDGFDYWVEEINSGRSVLDLIEDFLASEEYLLRFSN